MKEKMTHEELLDENHMQRQCIDIDELGYILVSGTYSLGENLSTIGFAIEY